MLFYFSTNYDNFLIESVIISFHYDSRGELIRLSHAVQNYVTLVIIHFFPPGTQGFSNSIAASFVFIFGVVQTASRCSTIWLLCWCQAMGNSLCAQMSGGVTGELALGEGTKKMGKGSPWVWKLVIVFELRIKYPKN